MKLELVLGISVAFPVSSWSRVQTPVCVVIPPVVLSGILYDILDNFSPIGYTGLHISIQHADSYMCCTPVAFPGPRLQYNPVPDSHMCCTPVTPPIRLYQTLYGILGIRVSRTPVQSSIQLCMTFLTTPVQWAITNPVSRLLYVLYSPGRATRVSRTLVHMHPVSCRHKRRYIENGTGTLNQRAKYRQLDSGF